MKAAPQCKDIPTLPVLEFLDRIKGNWANWTYHDSPYNVRLAMPPGLPEKLYLAKMRILVSKGLVDGCDCGCRGDFLITRKGVEYLRRAREDQDRGRARDGVGEGVAGP